MKDFLFTIGGLALIFAGIWLFIKLIFHPILFELDLRNQGKKGISYIMTGIQLAGIIAMYVYYNERNQGGVDAAIGFTAIAFVVAAVFASKRAKKLLLSKKEKWLLILAQIFSPVTIIVIILLTSLLFDKIGKILSGDSDHND